MKKLTFAIILVVLSPALFATGVGEQSNTVTIGYNRFLESAFGPGDPPIEVIRAAVAAEYPEITVEFNVLPDSIGGMRDAISVWMLAGDGTVDIYGIDTPWVSEFGRAGWATPLNGEIDGLSEFLTNGLDVFSYEGQRLGVPFWGSISGLYYRTDLLAEYGFDPPQSYDDLVEISETILSDRPEYTAFAWPGAQDEALVMVFSDFLYGFGGTYRDANGEYAFDSPEAIDALTFMKRLIDSGLSPAETTAWGAEEARRRFVEGTGIFLWHNHDLVTWLDDPERSAIADRWAFTTSPAQPGGRAVGVTGGFAFAMNPNTDAPEATRNVLEVIASRDVQRGFAMAWGPVQYYRGLYEDPEVLAANPNADRIEAVLESAIRRPPSFSYSQLSDILQVEIHAALTGRKSPEQALRDATTQIRQLD